MAEKVFVIGVGMTDFVKPSSRPEWDYPDMVRETGAHALADARIAHPQVEQVAAGYCFGDTTAGQRAVYELGTTGVPMINVNNACASRSSGAGAAVLASAAFVREHGLENRAVEIVGQAMATDFPTTFESDIAMVALPS